MNSRLLLYAVLIGLIPATATGCSFLFVNGPPADHDRLPYFTCTQSNAVPALDLIWAGLNGLGAAAALSADEGTYENQGQAVFVGLGWVVISGLSARHGFVRAQECRAATIQLVQRQTARDTTENILDRTRLDRKHPWHRR
jgi:hypothetical protein